MEPNTQEHSTNLTEESTAETLAPKEVSEDAVNNETGDAIPKEAAEEAASEEAVKESEASVEEESAASDGASADSTGESADGNSKSSENAQEPSDVSEDTLTEEKADGETETEAEKAAEAEAVAESDDAAEEEEAPKKRRSKFALGLLIGVAVFAVIAIGALITLWQFLKVYERTRPATTMNHYMETLDDSFWTEIVENELADESLPFENRDEIIENTVAAIRSSSYKYLLKSSETTDEKTVYRVLLSGKEILTLTLKPSAEAVGFGLHEWSVNGYELNEKNLPLTKKTYTYTVPSSAILALNGIMVNESYAIRKGFLASECTALEPTASCTMVTYQVSLYSEPQPTVVLDNTVLSAAEDGYYPYPASMWESGLLVIAPTEAELMVNGVVLDKEAYGSGFANYSGNAFEHATGHTYTVYSLPTLFDTPVITAILEGQTYTLTENSNTFSLDYPAHLQYTVNITVPTGAIVYINGIPVDPIYMTASAVPLASVAPFQNLISKVPTTDTYLVTGFFNQPQVTIAMTGNLQTVSSIDETTRTITWKASRVADDSTLSYYNDLALTYTKAYMKFVSDGYRSMYDNREAVHKLMIYGTDSYKAITRIYGGLYYVIPSTLTYHSLEIKDVLCHSEEVFECTVHYATSQKTGNVVVDNSGTIQLLFLKQGNTWKVASFALSQNTGN